MEITAFFSFVKIRHYTTKYCFFCDNFLYKSIEWRLQKELCRFEMKHPELEMNRFIKILEENDLEWSMNEMHAVDVSKLNLKAVLALLVGIFCSEKCIEESQYSFFQDKKIFQCIERLKILNS